MTIVENDNIERYLKKICEDKHFASYQRYKDLLTFIVTESINGRHVKEFNIAVKIYGENISEDKSDGRVRVYMHNLRKKLNSYYEESGRDDQIIFVLEKGSYNIKFTERLAKSEPTPKSVLSEENVSVKQKSNVKWWGISIIALALLVSVLFIVNRDKDLYCWESYLNSDTPTLCILADQVIVRPTTDTLYSGIIHGDIKNMSMYYDYIAQHPSDSLAISDFTLYSKSIPYAIHQLTKWFVGYDKDFLLTPESSFSDEVIKSSNLIYLGQFKSMDTSKRIFLRGSKRFSVDNRCIYVKKNGEKKGYRAKFDDNGTVVREYALVSFAPLDKNTNVMYFTSNHDIGTMAALNNFTNMDYLRNFYKQLPSSDSYFNVLLKVEGIGRTDITCEVVELEVIKPVK